MGSQDPYLLMETKIDIEGIYHQVKREVGIEDPAPVPYVIPTGSISLDKALKIGGYPAGRVTEIYGAEHSGKTTLAMHACVEAQKMGLPFGYIDNENTLDYSYFKTMGVKGEANKDWIHLTPETGEDTWRALEILLDKGVKLIVVDSVSAMTPEAELRGDFGEAQMGLQARMMSQGFRKTISKIAKQEVVVIFINQIRMKIGVMFGSPETTTGGQALKFYSSIRLDVRQVGDAIEENGEQIGKYSKVKVVKNKCSAPNGMALVPIVWGKGIDRASELFDEMLKKGVITKNGSFYCYKDTKVNGKANMIAYVDGAMSEFEKFLEKKDEKNESEEE